MRLKKVGEYFIVASPSRMDEEVLEDMLEVIDDILIEAVPRQKAVSYREEAVSDSVLDPIIDHATEVIGDRKEAMSWLGTPIRGLDFATPISLLATVEGHVLTSIDYSKMSDEDKAKEDYPRADHDYGLSWVRREGKGRVFYMAHGHAEEVYANKQMLEHLLAGIQYALGDLKADDKPSAKEQGK